jgi:uncharacterized integral membrane protein
MGAYIKAILLITIFLVLFTFGVKNSQSVQLSYYFNVIDLSLPLYAAIYIILLVGIVIGMVIGLHSRIRMRKTIKAQEKDIFELKDKIINDSGTRKEGIEGIR